MTPNRRRSAFAASLPLLVGATIWSGGVPALAATGCGALGHDLHQVQATSGSTLVTAWDTEYTKAVQNGMVDDGVLGQVADGGTSGLVAVHRFYRKGDWVSAPEQDIATWTGRGYADQGVAFSAAGVGSSCGVAVHRLVRQGVHREVLEDQVSAWTARGWADAGAKYRVASVARPTAPAPTAPAGDPDADGRFSLAVTPDTQNETLRTGAPLLAARNHWIVDHRDALDIRADIHVGDITNWDTDDHAQYVNASAAMKVLEDAGLPWIGAVGNHDAEATGDGGGARAGVNVHDALRDTATYNGFFGAAHFALRQGTADGREDNSYHVFDAAGTKWMVVVLEVWPRADKLAWARQVVADHPDRNVIIVTHDYLDWGGGVQGGNDGYGDLTPVAVHDQLVAPFRNVKVVLSGHEGLGQARVEDLDGHRVVALQQNYDTNTDALLRMLTVDVQQGTLTYSYASTNTSRVVTPDTTVDQMDWVR